MPVYARNKKARFDYEILDTLEAGLVLSGQEVKSVRSGHMKLTGGYVIIGTDAGWLKGAHIAPYRFAGHSEEYDPTRSRKLLLSSKEIAWLRGKSQEKGLTIVPLSVYTKGPYIKLEIGIARGKKKYDKREAIKRRDLERQIRQGG